MTITKLRKQRLQSKIQEARAELISNQPYFGILLMYLRYIAIDNIKNISTNGRCIYFNPSFIDKLTPYEMQFVLCHQIMHIVCGDIWRNEAYKGDEYHRAYDVIANDQLLQMGWNERMLTHLGKLQYTVPHSRYKIEEMSMLEIFDLFPFKLYMLDERTRSRYMADTDYWWDYKEDVGDDGVVILDVPKLTAYSEKQAVKKESEKQGKGKGKAKKSNEENYGIGNGEKMLEFWETKSQQAMQTAEMQGKGKGAGSVPGSIRRKIEEKKKSVVDWRKLLDDFVQEETTDYSFSPPDRRFADYDFFLPDFNEKEFVPKDILFMADTSGSIDQEDLGKVFAELRGAIEQFNGKIKGKLGFFDAEVTAPIPFSVVGELEKIIPYGGGGTDFTVIFDYIRDNMSQCIPSALVIFTDGYGPYPSVEATMNIPVLWIINNNDIEPPFGKVGRILSSREY